MGHLSRHFRGKIIQDRLVDLTEPVQDRINRLDNYPRTNTPRPPPPGGITAPISEHGSPFVRGTTPAGRRGFSFSLFPLSSHHHTLRISLSVSLSSRSEIPLRTTRRARRARRARRYERRPRLVFSIFFVLIFSEYPGSPIAHFLPVQGERKTRLSNFRLSNARRAIPQSARRSDPPRETRFLRETLVFSTGNDLEDQSRSHFSHLAPPVP